MKKLAICCVPFILMGCTQALEQSQTDAGGQADMPEGTQCVVVWNGANEASSENSESTGDQSQSDQSALQKIDLDEGSVVLFLSDPCEDLDLDQVTQSMASS